jgi:hypothetical protein
MPKWRLTWLVDGEKCDERSHDAAYRVRDRRERSHGAAHGRGIGANEATGPVARRGIGANEPIFARTEATAHRDNRRTPYVHYNRKSPHHRLDAGSRTCSSRRTPDVLRSIAAIARVPVVPIPREGADRRADRGSGNLRKASGGRARRACAVALSSPASWSCESIRRRRSCRSWEPGWFCEDFPRAMGRVGRSAASRGWETRYWGCPLTSGRNRSLARPIRRARRRRPRARRIAGPSWRRGRNGHRSVAR